VSPVTPSRCAEVTCRCPRSWTPLEFWPKTKKPLAWSTTSFTRRPTRLEAHILEGDFTTVP